MDVHHSAASQTRPVDDRRMLRRTLLVIAAWNLIGNLVLPSGWYIPANLAVAGCMVAVSRRSGFSWEDLGLSAANATSGLRLGMTAGLVILIVLALGLAIPGLENVMAADRVATDSSFDRWFVPLIRIPLGTVVMEEVLFRGVLLAALMRRHSVRTSVAASALVFGVWHVVPALETSTGSSLAVATAVAGTVAITTAAGVLFALLRLRSRSLIAPMLAHWATNGLAYATALIALRRT